MNFKVGYYNVLERERSTGGKISGFIGQVYRTNYVSDVTLFLLMQERLNLDRSETHLKMTGFLNFPPSTVFNNYRYCLITNHYVTVGV